MYQREKLGLDISSISTDNDSNIIGCHSNGLLTNEGRNKVSNPDLDTASKPDIDITKCTQYIYNNPLNLNLNTSSSNFSFRDYGTPTTPPKDRKES